MRQTRRKRGIAVLLGLLLGLSPLGQPAGLPGGGVAYAYTGTATVKAASLNVRSGAGTSYASQGKLAGGTKVEILSEQTGTDGNKWYNIRYTSGGASQTGYVSAAYVQIPVSYSTDANFEAQLNAQGFPESYKEGLRQLHAQYPNWVFKSLNTGLDWETVIENESQPPRNLVSTGSISSWKSVEEGAYNWDTSTWTGFDGSNWVAASKDIVRYYMDPRNFLDETYIFQFLSQEYNGSTQTREGLETMVKDTFLSGSTSSAGTPGGSADPGAPAGSGSQGGYDDSNYGPGVVGPGASSSGTGGSKVSLEPPGLSISAKERWIVGDKISLEPPGASQGTSAQGPGVSGPGASGSSQGPGGSDSSSQQPESSTGGAPSSGTVSYIDIIMNAGAQSGVNPYVLAAMIIQEQGTAGTSPLISGTYSGYEGYYNFFNVEAYQSGSMSAIQRGLWYASQSGSYGRPWNTVEKSIVGGAQNYGDNYVKAGQNTFYLKKFNVQGSNLYKHQYMSNVQAAASEGAKLSQAYTAAMKQSALEFIIPVYNNMPGQACAAPTGDGSPNNKLSSLSVDGFSLTPTFARDTESYNLIVDTSVSSVNIQAGAADAKARVSGAGTVSLGAENTDITVTVTAENGSVRNYVIHVAKQGGGPTGAGGAQAPAGEGSSGPGAAGPGVSGPGQADTSGPGGSNVTVVTVTN